MKTMRAMLKALPRKRRARVDARARELIAEECGRRVIAGSGNVFADVGMPDAGVHFLKAKVVAEIYRVSREQGISVAQVARRLGVDREEVAGLFQGRFRGHSLGRLLGYLSRFGNVEIVVRPAWQIGTGVIA